MAYFHRYKPIVVFKEVFVCNSKEVTIIIQKESDYPPEVFGAPRYFAAYINNHCVGSGRTYKELSENLKRWNANRKFMNFYREAFDKLNKFLKENEIENII